MQKGVSSSLAWRSKRSARPRNPMEEWRTIPSCPGYEASSLGSIRRCVPFRRTMIGRVLAVRTNRMGYQQIGLSLNGTPRTCLVHRLVCEAFHGPPPSALHVAAHNNGCQTDNAASNLRWATVQENEADKVLHGTLRQGDGHSRTIIGDYRVRLIRARVAFGEPMAQTARLFRVSHSSVWSIVHGLYRRSAGGYGIEEEGSQ